MKDTRDMILLPLFILLAMACGRERNKEQLPQLVQAESVMYEHPDNAPHILQRVSETYNTLYINRFKVFTCIALLHGKLSQNAYFCIKTK